MGAVAAEFIITTIKMILLAAVGVGGIALGKRSSGTKRMQNAAEKGERKWGLPSPEKTGSTQEDKS